MSEDPRMNVKQDASGNIIITGANNVVYCIYAGAEPGQEVIEQIQTGKADLESIPEAVPLPTMILKIDFANKERTEFHVTLHTSTTREYKVACPWKANPQFRQQLLTFRKLACEFVKKEEQHNALNAAAFEIGEALAKTLDSDAQNFLIAAARKDGPPPFLLIESDNDEVLALPWELMRLDGRWPVRDGRLDLARTVPAEGAPQLKPAKEPVTLLVNVSAPENSKLQYEEESYRIARALHDHPGVITNEMGEVTDLVEGLRGSVPPIGVHFSGHGSQGFLLFENEFGGGAPERISDLLNKIRQVAPDRFPRFFYLASCYGSTPTLEQENERDEPLQGVTSTAAQLHREGVTQVVGYFGPVSDTLSTNAEETFYREIGKGRRTRDAVRAARSVMAHPFLPGKTTISPQQAAGNGHGLLPYAWAQFVFYHRGPDYPLGLPVTPKYAYEVRARIKRNVEMVMGSGRSQILRAGFISRRTEMHRLRFQLNEGRNIHVVQGLGGLGKSVFCYEALKIYRKRGWRDITLWCSEVEKEEQPAEELVRQLYECAGASFGSEWITAVANLDERKLESPSQRFAALISIFLSQESTPPVVLHMDNLESLFHRPDEEDYNSEAVAEWRDAECAAIWSSLVKISENSGGRLALFASCRYRHPDFYKYLFPFEPMARGNVFRLVQWFDSFQMLSIATIDKLIERLAGHPRSVEFLDTLIGHEIEKWKEIHGDPPTVTSERASDEEWQRFIVPVLPEFSEKLRDDLLFEVIWTRVLGEKEQRLLTRLTVLRRPADWDLLRALCDPDDEEGTKDRAIRRLRDASLLTEVRQRRPEGGEVPFFEVHSTLVGFVLGLSDNAEALQAEGFHLAGLFLENRAQSSRESNLHLEAGHYLYEAAEYNRSFGLLWPIAEWQSNQGRCRGSFAILFRFLKDTVVNKLTLRYQAILYSLTGSVLFSLGNLKQAESFLRTAREAHQRIAKQDPDNTEWQRDLIVSHIKIGEVLVAKGNTGDALHAFRGSLTIAQRLVRLDPSNSEWQRDLSVSNEKIGNVLVAQGKTEGALQAYRDFLAIAQRLARQDPTNILWQRNLSVAHIKIGDIFSTQGKAKKALQAYDKSLNVRQKLVQQDPSNTKWQRDLAVAYERIGDALLHQGHIEKALQAYRKDLAIGQRLAQIDSSNAEWQHDLAISHSRVGDVSFMLGNMEKALQAYREDFTITQRLAQHDPANTQWQHDLSISYEKMGNVLFNQGSNAKALQAFHNSLSICQHLTKQDSSNTDWQRALFIAQKKTADVLLAQGDTEKALQLYRDALIINELLSEHDPGSARLQIDMSLLFLYISKALDKDTKEGKEEAGRLLHQGLEILSRLQSEGKLTNPQGEWIKEFSDELKRLKNSNE